METKVKIKITMSIKDNRVLVKFHSDDVTLDRKQVKAITDVLIQQLTQEN